MNPRLFLLVATLLLASSNASAQGTLVMRSVSHVAGVEGTFTIKAQDGNLAMEMHPSDGSMQGALSVIFRGDRKEMIMLDPLSRTYMVFDENLVEEMQAQVEQVAGQMQEVAEQMAGQMSPELLAMMPPEARAKMAEAMEKMKSGNLGGIVPGGGMTEAVQAAQPEPAPMRRTSQTGSAAGAPCRWYERIDGDKKHRYCAAAAGDVDGGEDVVRAMRGMVEFYQALASNFGSGMKDNPMATSPFFASNVLLEENLFPVLTKEFVGDELEEETQLISARASRIDPSDFEPPAGYTRRSMTGGMGQMPRR